jgi:hypothetical protein
MATHKESTRCQGRDSGQRRHAPLAGAACRNWTGVFDVHSGPRLTKRTTADMSSSMKTFHEWIQDGQLVRAAYIKYLFEQSMQQQQAEQLSLEDLSKDMLIITAFRASEGSATARLFCLSSARTAARSSWSQRWRSTHHGGPAPRCPTRPPRT